MAYDNNNSGMIARNKRKQQPNHPDYSGQCEVDGKQYWLSGWIKEGKPGSKLAGEKFFSLAFKPKDEAQAGSAAPASSAAADEMEATSAPAASAPAQAAARSPAPTSVDDDSVPF